MIFCCCSSSLCRSSCLTISAWILTALECDSCCYLVFKDCSCLFRSIVISCMILLVTCWDTVAANPERLTLRAATSAAIPLTCESARTSMS